MGVGYPLRGHFVNDYAQPPGWAGAEFVGMIGDICRRSRRTLTVRGLSVAEARLFSCR